VNTRATSVKLRAKTIPFRPVPLREDLLEEFIRSQIKALETRSGARPPRPVSCLVVEKVAGRCVAAQVGVAKGDLLAFVDGGPASRLSPKLYEHRASKRLYTFHAPARSEQIELAATGIEIGVELALTSDAIRARHKPEQVDFEAMTKLWERRDHGHLLEIASEALKIKGMGATPALLFEGVGLWEAGRWDEGMERIDVYYRQYRKDWTMDFTSIALHYFGLECLHRQRREEGIDALRKAFDYNALERTANTLAELTGVRPPMDNPKWLGKTFPADYSLPILEGGFGTVALRPTLHEMDPQKLLVVCLLASYRSNGPYGEFLQRWLNYATWFHRYLHGLHVITMEAKRYPNYGWHYKLEDESRVAGLPFQLLHDPKGEAHLPVAPDRSPFVLVLDRAGTIHYEGDLGTVDLWNTLSKKQGGGGEQ
jgi:hypothetical protein